MKYKYTPNQSNETYLNPKWIENINRLIDIYFTLVLKADLISSSLEFSEMPKIWKGLGFEESEEEEEDSWNVALHLNLEEEEEEEEEEGRPWQLLLVG